MCVESMYLNVVSNEKYEDTKSNISMNIDITLFIKFEQAPF